MSKQPGGYPKHPPPAYSQQPYQGIATHPMQPSQQPYQGIATLPMQPSQPYQGIATRPMQPYPQAMYPQQQGYVPVNQPMQPTTYGGPPPPYTLTPQQPAPSYPIQQMPMGHQSIVMPVTQGSYDAGARFHQAAPLHIPPPPPGVPPTGAQIAAAHGQTVVMSQNQSDWLSGGSGGGYTW